MFRGADNVKGLIHVLRLNSAGLGVPYLIEVSALHDVSPISTLQPAFLHPPSSSQTQ
jgi:hypothetical protein